MNNSQIEELAACPVCGHAEFSPWLSTKDFSISQEEFQIVACKQCGFKFTNPRPTEDAIGKYYESSNYISHHDESRGMVALLYKWVREHITLKQKRKWIERTLSHKGRLLDVGCGTGHFLLHMQRHGWEVSGVEPSAAASQKVKEAGIQIYEHINCLPGTQKFDAISMWHVLEHVHQLEDYLQHLKNLLTTNGYLFISVPNLASYDARHYGRYWAALDVPRHLYHFTPAHMKQLLEKVGLHLHQTIGMPLDAYYISLLSSEYRSGKKKWMEAIYRGSLSNWHATKTKNFSSMVYIVNKINQ